MKQYLVIANPPYDNKKTHHKILKLFKEKYPCVFVMPFTLYTNTKKNVMPDCCKLLDNYVFGEDCKSMSNKCIIGYNVKKDRDVFCGIMEKYVKYFSDSIENHFADKKQIKLYLRCRNSALLCKSSLWFINQNIEFTYAKPVSFDTEEEREQWKKLYSGCYYFKRLLAIVNSNIYVHYVKLQYFPPGTTLDDVKQHFHFTDEEIKALEDYAV